jgi:hypothetical protein
MDKIRIAALIRTLLIIVPFIDIVIDKIGYRLENADFLYLFVSYCGRKILVFIYSV